MRTERRLQQERRQLIDEIVEKYKLMGFEVTNREPLTLTRGRAVVKLHNGFFVEG